MTKNPYRLLGMGLAVGGAVFAPVSYFVINSVPLTAVALSAIMIGFTSIALANARPQISPETSQLILETGMENISALLEELGLGSKAIYLPSSMRTGNAQALIPLKDDIDIQRIKGKIPQRLIVRYGDDPDDMAIAVTAPGITGLDKLEITPGVTSSELEQTITYVMTGLLDMVSSVEVQVEGKLLTITVKEPRFKYENVWYYRCMGSPVASVIASIASEGLDKPVRIKDENPQKGKTVIRLEVLG